MPFVLNDAPIVSKMLIEYNFSVQCSLFWSPTEVTQKHSNTRIFERSFAHRWTFISGCIFM